MASDTEMFLLATTTIFSTTIAVSKVRYSNRFVWQKAFTNNVVIQL